MRGSWHLGEQLPSIRELADQAGLPTATVRRALEALASERLIATQQGRPAVVGGQPLQPAKRRPAKAGHDCATAGCVPHRCRPMSARTIRQIHSILSGGFAAAVRWEWLDRSPVSSARLPKAQPRSPATPKPATVAAVITRAREANLNLLALYVWLTAVTGARRGELCGLQWADIDLDSGIVHLAYSYFVRSGQKVRKDTKTHQDRHLAI
jgi:integrase